MDTSSRCHKPPIGIIPRKIHEKERAMAIIDTIARYWDADLKPMGEWLIELREYVERQ